MIDVIDDLHNMAQNVPAPWDETLDRAIAAMKDDRAQIEVLLRRVAALESPPDGVKVTLSFKQVRDLFDWFGADAEPDTEMTVGTRDGRMVAWFTDYPEEGFVPLDRADEAQA